MIYTVAKEITFIPEWNGNKKLAKGEQMKIIICLPSAIEVSNSYLDDTKDTATVKQFLLYTKRIENFKVEVNGKARKATPRDIVELPGLSGLWADIQNYYTDFVNVNKKK